MTAVLEKPASSKALDRLIGEAESEVATCNSEIDKTQADAAACCHDAEKHAAYLGRLPELGQRRNQAQERLGALRARRDQAAARERADTIARLWPKLVELKENHPAAHDQFKRDSEAEEKRHRDAMAKLESKVLEAKLARDRMDLEIRELLDVTDPELIGAEVKQQLGLRGYLNREHNDQKQRELFGDINWAGSRLIMLADPEAARGKATRFGGAVG